MKLRFFALLTSLLLWSSFAAAQTSPNLIFGQVPTPAQWNLFFSGKQDYLGAPPLLQTGGTMTGPLITAASLTSNAGFNIPAGAAPTSPNNGDVWETASSFFVRINGTTYDLLNGACSTCAALNVANTFTASPQTVQGLTTTQPGWYAQITGDTNARVRIGLNSTDVPSIGFGPGNAVRDTFIERAGAAALRLGGPDAAAAVAQILGVQNVLAGTSNTAGAALTIDGSRGTGTGAGGAILFKIAPAGSTGSAQNALATALSIFGTGGLSTGAAIDEGAGTLNLAGSLYNNGTAPTGTGAYVRATSAALVTPALGVATATSLAVGGCSIGGGALCVTGSVALGATTVTGSFTATGLVTNADLVSPTITVNTVACTLGASCTISAAASLVVGSTTITSGTAGRVLFDNGGTTLGEYSITGTAGSVVMSVSPTITTTLNVNGSAPSTGENIASFLDSGVNTLGQQMILQIGQSNTSHNRAQLEFYFSSAGSVNNHGSLGMFNADNAVVWDGSTQVGINTGTNVLDKAFTIISDNTFSIDGSGNMLIGGSIKSSGTSNLTLNTAGSFLLLQVSGSNIVSVSSTNFLPATSGVVDIGIETTNTFVNGWFSGVVTTGNSVIGSLPTCNSGSKGARYIVTNGNTAGFGGAVSGTGALTLPVMCTGSNWIYGEMILPVPANDNELTVTKFAANDNLHASLMRKFA